MEMYFLNSAACLAILLLFYRLLLEKEKMHRFKRFYLLASMVISIVIPWITFTTYVEVPATNAALENFTLPEINKAGNETNYLQFILWSIYGLGVLFFSFTFLKNLRELILKIKYNPKLKNHHVINVLLQEEVAPHTFWNYIFLNKHQFKIHSIPSEVFQHEEAHAIQKHSFDILFMELLQIIFWFNPLIYLTKSAIKLNHEFLADEAVLRKGTNTANYQETLLSFSSNQRNSSLSNSINYSSTRLTFFGKTFSIGKFGQVKKRFTVMKTKTSKKAILVRGFLLLPLLTLLLYSFSTKEVLLLENNKKDYQEMERIEENGLHIPYTDDSQAQEKATPELIEEYNRLVEDMNKEKMLKTVEADRILYIESLMTPEQKENAVQRKLKILQYPPEDQEKATPEMVAEYNKMAKHYNSMPTDGTFIKKKDHDRMEYIYGLMTTKQKKKAEPFPVPSPPPAPNSAMVAEYNKLAKFYANGVTREMIAEKGYPEIEKEFARLLYIYKLMTAKQKETAEELPPPPPPDPLPAPRVPDAKEMSPPDPPAPPTPEEAV